jgi:hypothetical protein
MQRRVNVTTMKNLPSELANSEKWNWQRTRMVSLSLISDWLLFAPEKLGKTMKPRSHLSSSAAVNMTLKHFPQISAPTTRKSHRFVFWQVFRDWEFGTSLQTGTGPPTHHIKMENIKTSHDCWNKYVVSTQFWRCNILHLATRIIITSSPIMDIAVSLGIMAQNERNRNFILLW